MSWIDFLMNGEGSQIDSDWATRCIAQLRYEPPQRVAGRTASGEVVTVTGIAERDALVASLYRENWDLKLAVAALIELVISKGLTDRQTLASLVEKLALGFATGTDTSAPEDEEDNPFTNLR